MLLVCNDVICVNGSAKIEAYGVKLRNKYLNQTFQFWFAAIFKLTVMKS